MEAKKLHKVHKATVFSCCQEKKRLETVLLYLRLDDHLFSAKAGQFIAIPPLCNTSVMPRPFTVARIVNFKDNEIIILFNVVGKNTLGYSQLKPYDQIEIIGPLGKEIVFDPEKGKCLFVGGGIGGAALITPAAKALSERKEVAVILGAKNEHQLVGLGFFSGLGLMPETITEEGSGKTGLVTDLLREALEDDVGASQVIACGPKIMLRRVAEMCKRYRNKCQVIVEEMMACGGMGSCKSCVIFGGEDGNERKHVCSDGPAFDAEWVYWPMFVPEEPAIRIIEQSELDKYEIDYTCQLGPLKLKYPFLNCSGTLDIEACLDGSMNIKDLGAIVTKGLSIKERSGNPAPRVCETPSGMLNSIGLEYIGIERFLKEDLPRFLELKLPIIVNINGNSPEEYAELARWLNQSGVAALEVNISCPNTKKGGMSFGKDPVTAAKVVRGVRKVTDLPLVVKLTPNVANIAEIAKAVEKAGTDIISLINTIEGAAIDVWTRKPKIASVTGGLSGPAIHPVAVAQIIKVSEAVKIPIIGMGGNANGRDAAEMMMVGASAVAFGTSGFANRHIYSEALQELVRVTRFHGFTATRDLVGSMLTN